MSNQNLNELSNTELINRYNAENQKRETAISKNRNFRKYEVEMTKINHAIIRNSIKGE